MQKYKLPPFEILISFFMNIAALIYTSYQAFLYGESIATPENEDLFSEGWSFIGRKRDDYDFEWESFVGNIKKCILWYICHVLLSEVVRQLKPRGVCFIHAVVGILFVLSNFKPIVFGAMFLVVFSYYVTMLVGKRYVWMLTMIWLVILNNLKHGAWKEGLRLFLSEREIYNVDISIAWLVLRVTSFSIDYCNAPEQIHDSFSTINYLAYAFYLPMYVHGPPLIYERYAKMIPKNRFRPIKELMCRLSELFLSLLRIGFIYCLNEICMHYIYATVIIYNPDQIAHMDCWTLYGFGYAMGQYFCNKYMVLYGFGLALAKFDRIDAQRKPMCIGRIHLYSKMWKNFDRGIYDFLFKHIYAELCTKTSSVPRKLVASCVSFAFIYLWHGFHTGFLLGWVLMNLTFLYIEQLGRHIAQSETYNRVLKPIGSNNIQRLNTALGAQLTIVTTILNITFIGGLSVGKWIVTHVYFTGGFLNYIIISITAYNVFQVSAFIFKCEKMTRN